MQIEHNRLAIKSKRGKMCEERTSTRRWNWSDCVAYCTANIWCTLRINKKSSTSTAHKLTLHTYKLKKMPLKTMQPQYKSNSWSCFIKTEDFKLIQIRHLSLKISAKTKIIGTQDILKYRGFLVQSIYKKWKGNHANVSILRHDGIIETSLLFTMCMARW